GDVALVAILVVVRAGLDPTLDVDLAALRQVFRAHLRALAPHDDAVPLGALLALPVFVVPALARRDAQLADSLPAGRVSHLGICAEVAYENDLVNSPSHKCLLSVPERLRSVVWIGTYHTALTGAGVKPSRCTVSFASAW